MSVQQRSCMQAALSCSSETGNRLHLPVASWVARGALAAASLTAVSFIETPPASAVPAYARQTGQPCATCHTAFPELTPFGRQFKLMGYTSGGTRCNDGSAKSDETQVPLAVMAWPTTMTHVASTKGQNPPPPAVSDWQAPNVQNDQWIPGQFSLFVAGQLYCDVGSFAQMTYDHVGNAFAWDNTDIRYAKSGVIDGTNIVYGVTANNNPTVQDVWNTVSAWGFPYIPSEVAPAPAFGTLLGTDAWATQVAGAGGYVWINNSIYAELTAYTNLPARLLTDLNGGYDNTATRFEGAAPYWRVAYEKTWDKNSLMFGTIGMYADTRPGSGSGFFVPGVTDPTLDLGLDSQYQWIGEEHVFTVRSSYIWENKKNNAELLTGGASNSSDTLNDFNINASYIYDRKYSFSAGWFDTWGKSDLALYGTPNGSPNSAGWNFDIAYLPFMRGGPDLWPWFNARIGVEYTHYDKFDGTTFNVDSIPGLKASGNDTVFVYTWLMF
ncbi:MAG: hypothetical protein ACLPX9_07320 [Rhodomicrobium sp.]